MDIFVIIDCVMIDSIIICYFYSFVCFVICFLYFFVICFFLRTLSRNRLPSRFDLLVVARHTNP